MGSSTPHHPATTGTTSTTTTTSTSSSTSSRPVIAITGATGNLGRHLTHALIYADDLKATYNRLVLFTRKDNALTRRWARDGAGRVRVVRWSECLGGNGGRGESEGEGDGGDNGKGHGQGEVRVSAAGIAKVLCEEQVAVVVNA